MASTLELEQSHHQARRYLVSLVWQLSKQNPDFGIAFEKAEKLCSALTLCRISEASIARQTTNDDASLITHICTEGGD
jgi:hypothetical protein